LKKNKVREALNLHQKNLQIKEQTSTRGKPIKVRCFSRALPRECLVDL